MEINPLGARSDVWIGSFDEMPAEWEHGFRVMFSNSFDHSQNPQKTAGEWKRVLQPGGYLIFCFSRGAEPTLTDPVGHIQYGDVVDLFGGELVYFHDEGSRKGYSEVIIRVDET